MNNLLPSLRAAALAAALSAVSSLTPVQAAGNAMDSIAQAMTTTGSLAVKAAGPYVEVGSYRIWVSMHLGKPSLVLADGTWVYKNFSVDDSNTHGALIVNFTQGRVSELRLVSPAVLTALSTPKSSVHTLIASR